MSVDIILLEYNIKRMGLEFQRKKKIKKTKCIFYTHNS